MVDPITLTFSALYRAAIYFVGPKQWSRSHCLLSNYRQLAKAPSSLQKIVFNIWISHMWWKPSCPCGGHWHFGHNDDDDHRGQRSLQQQNNLHDSVYPGFCPNFSPCYSIFGASFGDSRQSFPVWQTANYQKKVSSHGFKPSVILNDSRDFNPNEKYSFILVVIISWELKVLPILWKLLQISPIPCMVSSPTYPWIFYSYPQWSWECNARKHHSSIMSIATSVIKMSYRMSPGAITLLASIWLNRFHTGRSNKSNYLR